MAKSYRIDGKNFYSAVVAGAHALIENKNDLNRINVFPVADGDTGSNLSATVRSILDYMVSTENLGTVANSAADGALIGARGNSGMILAQFFYAFAAETRHAETLELPTFIQAVKSASSKLSKVLLNPVEGTLLTLIQKWAEALERRFQENPTKEINLNTYATDIMNDVRIALENTPEQLPILKERGVVDSGAKGFYHFLEGVTHFINTGSQDVLSTKSHPFFDNLINHDGHMGHDDHQDTSYRYCCEALLKAYQGPEQSLIQKFAHLGDSLIVAGGPGLYRLHMHTSEPESFFSQLAQIGQVEHMKADDMLLQSEIVKKPTGRIAIVTDSIADIPADFALNHQVSILPLHLIIDGVDYLDRIAMTTKRFYSINATLKEQPASSMPNTKQIESLYSFLLGNYEGVLVLSVSDKLSGTYNLLNTVYKSMVANDSDLLGRIRIVNTLKNSGAQGLLAMYAAETANGEAFKTSSQFLSAKDALEKLALQVEDRIPKTVILVAVNNTNYLGRSGRVSQRASRMVNLLGLKPIMTLDPNGYGKAYGMGLSARATLKKIKGKVLKAHRTSGIDQYSIVHAACPEKAEALAKEMTGALGFAPRFIAEISPIVGATAGEGALAISYTTQV